MIPLGAWEPDSFLPSDGKTASAINVLPAANGWGPCPSSVPFSTALPDKCVGAVSVRTADNSYQIYAGTRTKLYRFNSGTTGWDDVSGGLTFSVPDGDYWSFDVFGTHILATNISDGLHEADMSMIGDFAPTAGTPPRAKFVSVVGDFVVLACLDGAQNTMHWSALNDRTEWTTGTNFSDTQMFPDGGVIRAVAGQEAGLIFQEDTIRRMTLVGGSQIFNFSVLARNRRLRASYSVITLGQVVYAAMDHGICAYTQAGETALGAGKIDEWFKSDVQSDLFSRVVGCADPIKTRIYWAYSSVNNVGNDYNDRVLVYDITFGRFSIIDADTDFIFPCATAGYSLEALDAFGTMETLTASLDSSIWSGGTPNFGQIGSNHIGGFRGGSPAAAEVIASDMALSGVKKSLVTSIYAYTDSTALTAAVAGKDRLAEVASYPASSSQMPSGRIPVRRNGRFHSVKFEIPSGETWKYLSGFDLDFASAGGR